MQQSIIRAGLVALIVALYFFLLRPIRADLNTLFYIPLIENTSAKNHHILIDKDESSSVSNKIIWRDDTDTKEFYLKVPFGLHFLLGIIGLVILAPDGKFYKYLILVQIGGSGLALISFYISSISLVNFLIFTDLITRYLIPLCSLGMVPLALIDKRNLTHE